MRYSLSEYTRGDNASGLIYACAYADFLSINRDKFDVVAVTGNSMGWYIALACSGVLDSRTGFEVFNTMGTLMHESLIGGQLIYPFVDQDWREIPGKRQELLSLMQDIPGLYISIHLGCMLVFAGDLPALDMFESRLERVHDHFPMRLENHAGFHSPLQTSMSAKAKATLVSALFDQPDAPLIDGRGHVWYPNASKLDAMWDYTFGFQIVEPYDFTTAISASLHEFAPEVIIILGPGKTLGGAVAQSLIAASWRGIDCKEAFIQTQKTNPFVLSMGMDAQRKLVSTI